MKRFNENYQRNEQVRDRRYMPGLDGLRALAVLAVIAYHLNLAWAPGGLLGVCLFFVLSGYLITDLLVAQWDRSGHIDLKDFWLRRARRLLPALFVMLAGIIAWTVLLAPARLAAFWADIPAAIFYASNWWLIFHHVSYFASFGPPSPLGHLWSLAIEEQFYLVWPLLLGLALRYLPRRGRLIALTIVLALGSALAMALLYKPGLDPSRVYYGTDTRAFALLIGAALAFAWPSRKLTANLSFMGRLGLDIIGSAGLFIVLGMITITNEYQPFLYRGGLLLFSFAAAVLVAVLAHPASRLGKLFALRPLRWLGVISYGVYLWHYPVIVLTNPAVNTSGLDTGLALRQLAASTFLAVLSWFIIEEPIRRGRRAPAWWRQSLLAVSGKVTLLSVLMFFSASCLVIYGSTTLISSAPSRTPKPQVIDGAATAITGAGPQNTESQAPSTPVEPAPKDQKPEDQKPESGAGINPGEDKEVPVVVKPGKATTEKITVIGDSVMVDAEPALKKLLPGIVIDAQIGRQMIEAPGVISKLKGQGKLAKIVIIELGTNGPFTAQQLMDLLDSLGQAEQIILVNTRVPRSWEGVVNQTLKEVAPAYPKVKLVDWYTASSGHNAYFYPDGVHLNPAGVQAYASLVARALTGEAP
jgi:peptidoglycan/LPS O-acetylase OafA/YrhL